MTTPSTSSSYSELFEEDDPEFLEALATTALPGDAPSSFDNSERHQKRQRSEEIEVLTRLSQELINNLSQASEGRADSSENGKRKRLRLEDQRSAAVDLGSGLSENVSLNLNGLPSGMDLNDALLQPSAMSDPFALAVAAQISGGTAMSSSIAVLMESAQRCDDESPAEHLAEPIKYSTNASPPTPSKRETQATPVAPADPARVPSYSAATSNEHAALLMQNAEFRAAHTSAAGADFIDGFYKNSRLHHLSAWKVELRALVVEAQERAEKAFALGDATQGSNASTGRVEANAGTSMRGNAFHVLRSPGKGKERAKEADAETVIMHCDFDCFFASVGILDRPYLKNMPVVVCHSQGAQGGASSTSEVSSANYKAREFGIRNGMSLQQARKLCPAIVTIPYEFEKYKEISLQLYTILMSHADDLQAVSVDEALIDVTSAVKQMPASSDRHYDPAKEFADMLRGQIRQSTGCEVSIGISHNIMLARLATRKAKPAGSFHLTLPNLQKFVENMQIDELHGFGRATREKALEKLGVSTLGELAKKPRSVLCDALGKTTGETLYNAVRGIDHRKLESDKPRRSVSAEINYGIRFENTEQAQAFMFQLAEEVARRLDAIDVRGRSLTLKIMKRDPNSPVEPPKFLGHGCCNVFSKQVPLSSADGRATSDALVIGQQAWSLLKGFAFDPKELRGIGIQIQKLEKASAGPSNELGQSKLAFKPAERVQKVPEDPGKNPGPSKDGADDTSDPVITVQAPSSQEDEITEAEPPAETSRASTLELPSFSQVDQKAFESLPEELRSEIKQEYRRRSTSPALSAMNEGRTLSVSPGKQKTTDKGTPLRRITQALAPRNRSSLSSAKHNIFEKCQVRKGPTGPQATTEELQKLGIDPVVFAQLPVELQLEQVANARFTKSFGGAGPSKR